MTMDNALNIIPIDSIDDPRVACYKNLKDRELAAMGGQFITEGSHTTVRLLVSGYEVVSVMVAPNRLPIVAPHVPAGVPVYVAPQQVMDSLIGFKFHSGVIGCGRRRQADSLDGFMGRVAGDRAMGKTKAAPTLIICPDICNADNVGSLIRIASGMGAEGMIFGQEACDPFWRRSIRVSMGNVFFLPVYQASDIASDLVRLRDHYGYTLAGTVLDTDATPLSAYKRPKKVALLLGNEAQGLGPRERKLLDVRLTIPMHHGTDSLNVSTAAAVFLYELTKPA